MKTPFYGRELELNELMLLCRKQTASIVALTGRRRIGKSRLVHEFANRASKHRFLIITGLPPAKKKNILLQKQNFASQLQRATGIPPIKGDDWQDLFDHMANITQRGKWIILLDEISWMGSKDSLFLGKLKNTWDLRLKNNPGIILVLCGSVSGWIEKNIISSTGFFGRISLHFHLPELALDDCKKFWGKRMGRVAPYDKLKILSVTGGVPRYLEEILPTLSAEENIRRLCFQREGMLFNEFDLIFNDLFGRRAAQYKKIVMKLATGRYNLNDICQHLGLKKSGVVSGYLNDLVLAGFAVKEATWDLHSRKTTRLFQYRLTDNYLRFYFKHILPQYDNIKKRLFSKKAITSLPGWESGMGFQFENLVIKNNEILLKAININLSDIVQAGPYFQYKTKKKQGCQIDYLIQTRHGPLYLFEIKFKRTPIGGDTVQEVKNKINRLSAPKYASILPVLVHVNGISEEVADSEFFSNIIDFSEHLT